jgi:hypothetical protein
MDETYNKHAYRCLPLSAANVNGWEMILQQEVVVVWEGGVTVPRIIDGEILNGRPIANCNKIGMIDFHLGWAINTEIGFSTWIGGSPNYFVDGASPLSALIPSFWWPDEVQMSWRLTTPGKEVVFEAGTPFTFFFVFPTSLLENTTFEIKNLWDDQELIENRSAYGAAKMKKHKEEPWTWMNGIRTGLDERGREIGPKHEGLSVLADPYVAKNQ